MTERLNLDMLVPTLISSLTERQLKGITKGTKGEREGLITLTNLVYAAQACLQDHSLIGANPFLTTDHCFAFARRLTLYVYDRSLILIHYDFHDQWKREWKAINQRLRHRMKQAEVADGFVGGAQWRLSHDQKQAETRHLHDSLIDQTQVWFAPRVAQLAAVTILNESFWEQAFFVRLFGHEQSRWFQLLDPARCFYDYRIGPHTVTLAFLGLNGQNTAISIVPTRTADGADQGAAEQWCIDNGWTFFGFTHADIAADPDACVAEVESGVAWHLSPY